MQKFKAFMESLGYAPGVVLPDSQIRRCYVEGDKRGTKNGWYTLNAHETAVRGVFGSHKTNARHTWKGSALGVQAALGSPTHLPYLASVDFSQMWGNAEPPVPSHPYLSQKGVKAHGIRQLGPDLLIPIRSVDGRLVGLQRIHTHYKRFVKGSKPSGGMHWLGAPGPTILIAEGYATAASVHEATGRLTVVAFFASNLERVAVAIRDSHPDSMLFLMADEDGPASAYAGERYAHAAAYASGGTVVTPSSVFGEREGKHG